MGYLRHAIPKSDRRKTGVNNGKDFEGVRYSIRQLVGSNMTWKETD